MRRLVVVLLVLAGAGARAERDRGELFAGARVGAAFPDAWSRLGPSFVVGVEAGWVLPVARHRLALALDGAFTAPGYDGSAVDPTLGSYSFQLAAREVIVGASLVYRHPLGRWTPYGGLGPRLVVLDARAAGMLANGARLPPTHDTAVGGGGGGLVGLGVRLGPGEAFADLRVDAAPVHDRTSGDVVAGAVFLAAGWRFIF